MIIEQFEDKGLAHFSYAVMSEGEMAIIDPARNPQPYYEYAMLHDAWIVAVVETHPHADFVSSHWEISQTKEAPVYTSRLTGADYTHTPFDEGISFRVGELTLHAINTPGHSPDSICVLVLDNENKPQALFSGDTLFIGDVGRPDLREDSGHTTADRKSLARAMYHSTREKLLVLPDDVLVYPTHGAGSLCGKGISNALSSTMGAEKQTNAALQAMTEEAFVDYLLADQPFVPLYFPFAVELNKKGAPFYKESLGAIPHLAPDSELNKRTLIIDTRPAAAFRAKHLPNSINLHDGLKFETWLGAIVSPKENFYMITANKEARDLLIAKTAKIGYEKNVAGVLVKLPEVMAETSPELDVTRFKNNPEDYTIIDIRNRREVQEKPIFPGSLNLPLPELRQLIDEIPTDKPILVHCAGGYRSAIGSSIIAACIKNQPVYDLGEAIQTFS